MDLNKQNAWLRHLEDSERGKSLWGKLKSCFRRIVAGRPKPKPESPKRKRIVSDAQRRALERVKGDRHANG